MERAAYKSELRELQLAMVDVQKAMIARGDSAVILIEGRDGAGKGGAIKRITEYVAPRQTRVVALDKPSDRERKAWHLQRYTAQLPVAGELVLFDRSWYNRAGVERVMGFCSADQVEAFFHQVGPFEAMIADAGMTLVKYYIDVTREEQAARLQARREDPLKNWKISEIDEVAVERYDDYTAARDEMLMRTSHPAAPWRIVKGDDKMTARIHIFRDLLRRLPSGEKPLETAFPDPNIVAEFTPGLLETEHLAS